MIDHDCQTGFVEELPTSFNEAGVDEVKVLERNHAGQERKHPRQADDVEVDC